MKKIFVFILLLMSQLVFAGNSVSYLGLNGPVKCYKAHSQVYYFDEAGYLTHADRCRTVDIRLSWKECYKHVLDESGILIKTYIAKTAPPFVEEAMSDSIVYTPKTNQFIDDFYKNKTGKRRKKLRLSDDDTARYYYKKGILDHTEHHYRGVTFVAKYYYNAKSDSLETVKISSPFLSIYYILDGKGNTLKYYAKTDDSISDEQYSYYDDGRVKQKTMYRKNYNVAWEIHNIDCVITYFYDDWKNLVKEEWYHKDSKETSVVEYIVEYY